MNDNMPIFIVGAPRSGTTLLAQILSNHPNIFIFNESLFYDFIVSKQLEHKPKKEMINLIYGHLSYRIDMRMSGKGECSNRFGCRLPSKEAANIKCEFREMIATYDNNITHREIFRGFLTIVAKNMGSIRWGEKTPNHVFSLDRIIKDFPQAKVINIVRDPIAFLKSYKFAWRQTGGKKESKNIYHPIISSLLWLRSIKAFEKAITITNSSNSFFEIRYEDLVDDTEATIKKVCEFLGEPFVEEMLFINGSNTSFRKRYETLPGWEVGICEKICTGSMRKYRYTEKRQSNIGIINWIKAIVTLIPFAFRSVPLVKKHFGGSFIRYLKARRF